MSAAALQEYEWSGNEGGVEGGRDGGRVKNEMKTMCYKNGKYREGRRERDGGKRGPACF